MADAAKVIGVLGAGTMGSGIAQLAAQSGARTLLFDPDPAALERGLAKLGAGVRKLVEKGRIEGDADEIVARATGVATLSELADCDLVIEAAPEILELKHRMFSELAEVVSASCVLASNTSSIPITAIAAGVEGRERVVGMHFFNPAPLMALVEVIAGMESGEAAVALARATGEAMGRRVIEASDGPGFIVNRVNRPFGLEALRSVHERVADPATVDRVVRLGGGYKMGPFELQDLVGIETGLTIAKSFFELGFGEPRWRPSPLSERMVASGRYGRKTGHGWFDYDGDGPYRPADPQPPALGGGDGGVAVLGDWPVAAALRARATEAGWDTGGRAGGWPLIVDCDGSGTGARAVLHVRDELPGGTVGFHVLPTLGLVELIRDERTPDELADRVVAFFTSLGLLSEWIGDSPGGVAGRLVFQTINEASFALGEGVGSEADIDDGMKLGMSHPRGPFEWLALVGAAHVVAVLDALRERHGDGYRVATSLRRRAR
jgi:3-hydroxybutyryl-CoA dehydrogenase